MDGSGGPKLPCQIPANGLTVLVDPDGPSLDIVFVHGFTGHPEWTWTHKRGGTAHGDGYDNEAVERPAKFRRLSLLWKSPQEEYTAHKAVYWPRDLVPLTVPNARVLTYGYDTHIRHCLGPPVSRNTVYDIAWDFLVALESERRQDASRPVLFIAHSLGGIIVKEMLRRSNGCQIGQSYLHRIFESTIGIIFFGTPHGGADPRGFLQHVAQKVIEALGWKANEQIVNTLLPSSERLRELRDEFSPIAHQREWIIHSFQEQFGVTSLNNRKVVEDTSSYLNYPLIETTEHIAGNHMDMCRFTGLEDVEYKKVAAALNRICVTALKQSITRERSRLSEDQRKMLLNSLGFDQIDARLLTIKNAHAKTCKWLLSKPEYCDWLDVNNFIEHHGFLWIKGKPGTGKSTIMKYALAHARRTMKDRIVIVFFFNARGGSLEKSTLGMYRSLLLQLLEKVPELQSILDTLETTMWSSSGHHGWTVETLKELFEHAIISLRGRHLTCYIDALDECDEKQIRDMISFFEHLGERAISDNIRFQVCFSSRHYPHITIKNGLSLILEGQEGHHQDIINYLGSELKIGHGKLAEQIRDELLHKASGVFMWVVLVVEMLNTEYDGGRIHALRQRIQDIPVDLHDLFRDILTRGPQNRDELLLCIQWVLFAEQPLTPEELYFAILTGINPEAVVEWDPEVITPEAMRRFILNSSKGLVEVSNLKTPTVQFIHESVRDFLLKENGLSKLWFDLGSNFGGQSHERLKQCCVAYMNMEVTDHVYPEQLPKALSQESANLRQSATNRFPFLKYAVLNVLYHAEVAENSKLPQDDFIRNFPRLHWINLHNLFAKYDIHRYTKDASLLYILAENNMANLIRASMRSCPSQDPISDAEKDRYGTPFLAALATGSEDAVCAILKSEVDRPGSGSALRELYAQYCQRPDKRIEYGRDRKYHKDGTMSYTAAIGDITLTAFLLETGKFDPNSVIHGQTLLLQEVRKGHCAIVELLLSSGKVDPDPKDNHGQTPLLCAAFTGQKHMVELLLSTGKVDPDSRDKHGRTPLSWAADGGHKSIMELILSTGRVDPDARDKNGRTPLLYAVRLPYLELKYTNPENLNSRLECVKLLLSTGKVDPLSADEHGNTPLSEAKSQGLDYIVNMLLACIEQRRLRMSSQSINVSGFEGQNVYTGGSQGSSWVDFSEVSDHMMNLNWGLDGVGA